MELQINDLISSIRKDGIESANAQADEILTDAKARAEAILAESRAEAARMVEDARAEIEVFRSSARLNAQQARRDAVLAFRQEVQAELSRILEGKVRQALDAQAMARLLVAAVGEEDPAGYVAEVGQVSDALRQELAEQIRAGLELRPDKRLRGGFRLTAKDGSGYLDCSDEALTQLLQPFFRDMQL